MKKLGNGSWAKARRVCGIRENYRQYVRREQHAANARISVMRVWFLSEAEIQV